MLIDSRWLPVLLLNLLLVLATQYVNGLLSSYLLHLYINAALVIAPALLLGLRGGLGVIVVTSIFYDAGTTGAFGLAVPMMLTAFIFIYLTRSTVKQPDATQILITSILTNTLLFAVHAFAYYSGHAATGQYIADQLLNHILSNLAVSLVSLHITPLNRSLLDILNLNTHSADYMT